MYSGNKDCISGIATASVFLLIYPKQLQLGSEFAFDALASIVYSIVLSCSLPTIYSHSYNNHPPSWTNRLIENATTIQTKPALEGDYSE